MTEPIPPQRQWTHALPILLPTVAALRENTTKNAHTGNHELEARLGRFIDGIFVTGVSKEFWDSVLEAVKSYPMRSHEYPEGWHSITRWSDAHIFYYTPPLQPPTRTTVLFDDVNSIMEQVHVQKKSLRKNTLLCTPLTVSGERYGAVADHDPNCWDVRVSLSRETPVHEDALVPSINTDRVAIRQRKSFLLAPPGGDKPVWSFDFSMVWTGATMAEAEQNQRRVTPELHIEVELLEPTEYLSRHDDEYVATSLLMKVCDLIGKDKSFTLCPVMGP